jgi:hypothetical protein
MPRLTLLRSISGAPPFEMARELERKVQACPAAIARPIALAARRPLAFLGAQRLVISTSNSSYSGVRTSRRKGGRR